MTEEKEKESFSSLGKLFQENLVHLILKDRKFSDQIKEVLNVNFLEQKYLQIFVSKIYAYKEKYKLHPNIPTLKTILKADLGDVDDIVKKQILEFVSKIIIENEYREIDGEQYTKDKALDFCKKQKVKERMIKCIDLLSKCSFEEIRSEMNEALNLGLDNDFGYDYIEDFEERYKYKARNPVSSGWDLIDNITGGGLGSGELGVVISSTGGGKSFCLTHLGAEALKQGKTVIHYTLELSDTSIAIRYDSCLTNVSLKDLHVCKEAVLEKIKQFPGRLIIKEYPTKSASVQTLRNHIEKLKARGINIDMIIVDYADLLTSKDKFSEKRHALESIYEEIRSLAQENECPVFTASQCNRCFCSNTELLIERDNERKKIKLKDVKVGDLVETHKGFKEISWKYPEEIQDCYEITLKSGKKIICSEKHQFPVYNQGLKSIKEGLKEGDHLYIKNEKNN